MLYFVGSFAIYYNVLKKKASRGAYIILPVILSTDIIFKRVFKKKNNSNTVPNTREKKILV